MAMFIVSRHHPHGTLVERVLITGVDTKQEAQFRHFQWLDKTKTSDWFEANVSPSDPVYVEKWEPIVGVLELKLPEDTPDGKTETKTRPEQG